MKNLVAALGAALLICWGKAALATAADETAISPDAVAHERSALQTVIAESRQNNPDRVLVAASLKEIVTDPAFIALSENERHAAFLLYGAALFDSRDFADAQMPIKTASEMAEGAELDWDMRLRDDFGLRDYADAVLATTRLAQKWPERLRDYTDSGIFLLVREAGKLSPSVESDFLEALHGMQWHPRSEFRAADSAWLSLLRVRLARGDVAGAKAIAMELRDPVAIIALQIDDRFDDIVREDPGRFDVTKAYDSSLADLKAKSAAAPDKLEGVNAVARLLIAMMRPDEALTLATAALTRLNADQKAYSDTGDQRNWTEDIRSRALRDLGRNDEAFAAMKAGAAQGESGGINVSQAINLADEYNYFDRPKDALDAISAIDLPNASNYGRMALQDARACAYFGLNDASNLDIAVDYLRAHKQDGTQPYLGAMLFTGDTDAAAAEVISELQDPARRTAMLAYLQEYAPDPYPTKRTAAMHEAWIAVRNRPDVAAEIAKVGHINKYALRLPTY